MIQETTLRACVCLLLFATCPGVASEPQKQVTPNSVSLELQVSPPSQSTRVGAAPSLKVVIINRGKSPVVLVQPGDGSTSSRRTPIISWHCTSPGPDGPRDCTSNYMSWCGNTNGIEQQEVFELLPGASKELGAWVQPPPIQSPGIYRLTLDYENRPTLRSQALGSEDTMARIRASTPCHLQSNEVTLEVER